MRDHGDTLWRIAPAIIMSDMMPADIPDPFVPNVAAQNYDKLEVMIPMRDGIKLFTLVLIPKRAPKPAPMLLTRTPYGTRTLANTGYPSPTLTANLSGALEDFIDAGYIRIYQDVRGKFKSEGDYVMYRAPGVGTTDHVTDTWDTVDWLIKHVPGNNGRVGITGVSYPGYLAFIPLLDPHPALCAAVPINAVIDLWLGDDFFHNGAFRLFELEYFYRQTVTHDNSLKPPFGHYDLFAFYLRAGNAANAAQALAGDMVMPAWERMARRTAYDQVWRAQALQHALSKLERVPIPTMNVHAWFDAEDIYGPIAAHTALADKPGAPYHFVAGPWVHGQPMDDDGSSSGKIQWDADTSLWFRRKVMLPFLNEHLHDVPKASVPKAPKPPVPRIVTFETGANEWRTPAAWPPPDAQGRELYLIAGGGLSFDPPPSQGSDKFTSDPAKPVPFQVRPIASRYRDHDQWAAWLLDDQRPVVDRPDVLVYTSDVLTEPITIAGEVRATLFAYTTGSDADWVVKLIDVYPDEYPRQPELGGYQLMISADILRGRFRTSFERAEAITPGAVLEYTIRLPHAYHTFRRGHRLMVQIHSTWFPLYDRNPQTFVDTIYDAPGASYVAQTHAIHCGGTQASRLQVSVLSI